MTDLERQAESESPWPGAAQVILWIASILHALPLMAVLLASVLALPMVLFAAAAIIFDPGARGVFLPWIAGYVACSGALGWGWLQLQAGRPRWALVLGALSTGASGLIVANVLRGLI